MAATVRVHQELIVESPKYWGRKNEGEELSTHKSYYDETNKQKMQM
jgi:hypothetical protein